MRSTYKIIKDCYDQLAPHYIEAYKQPAFIAEDKQTYYHIRRFLRDIKSTSTLLDVGCSTGEVLRNLGWFSEKQYLGIDISPKMIEIARQQWPAYKFVNTSFESFSSDGLRFDCIISLYGTMDYVDPELSVVKLKNLLSSSGRAIIHYASRNRYKSSCVGFDKSLDGNYWWATKSLIEKYRKKFKVTVIKQNCLHQLKGKMEEHSYYQRLRAEESWPLPLETFAWILLLLEA